MKELAFLNIDGMYGGSQERFGHPMMKLGGCSTVCACHAAACLARKDPSRAVLSPLLSLTVTEGEWNSFAKRMYKYVHPTMRGMPSTKLFERAFSRYAASVGAKVSFRSLQGEKPYESAEAFVRGAVDSGYTVQYLLLLHKLKELSDMEWHWFTVTGYDEGNDGFDVIYSTWGKRCSFSLKKLWDTGNEERGGLLTVL